MKMGSCLFAAAATALLASPAEAKQKPVWEIGVGGFGTYSADYPGSDHETFGGFPVIYVSYRSEDFNFLSDGLFGIDADNQDVFDFGLSIDGNGKVKSEDRLGLDEIDYEGEIGPKFTFALYADGHDRLEASLAGRAAFELNNGYIGWVLQPEVAYLTTVSPNTRVGFAVSPKWGFDGYNDRYYSTPFYHAEEGYIGTDFSVQLANDVTDRLRISGEVRATWLQGAENEDSPLIQRDWNVYVRLGFTYALFQSDETIDQ